MPIDFAIGDVIRLRKPHPCGGFDWTVLRIGADIGLRCVKCGRRLMLERSDVERRFKTFIARPDHHEPFAGSRAMQGFVLPEQHPTGASDGAAPDAEAEAGETAADGSGVSGK